MAASSHLKTQTQTQTQTPTQAQSHSHSHSHSTKTKRRKRRETTISASASSSPSPPPPPPPLHSSHIVSTDANWCCAPLSAPSPPAPPHHNRTPPIPSHTEPDPTNSDASPAVLSQSPSRGWTPPTMDPHQPATSFPAYPTYPSSYSKFNSALNAGLLNPMSPPPLPLDKTRSSPTLFDMMANEQEYHPRGPTTGISNSIAPPVPSGPPRVQDRQLLLQERVAELLGNCSPGNQFNDPDSSDVRLTLTSKDGLTVSLSVHRHILVAHSRFFAAKLSDRWSKQQRSLPHLVEISDCDDVEVYIETLRLMYCKDLRRQLMKEDVSKVLGILKVSAAIVFDAGVLSCLEYLEAAPWAEDDDEKVATLLTQLHLENSGAGEVLKRVSLEAATSYSAEEANGSGNGIAHVSGNGNVNGGGEEILVRLLQVVLEGKDEKARREMKGLVSKMLRESNNSHSGRGSSGPSCSDLSKESLYSACNSCLKLLHNHFTQAAASDLSEAAYISRQADNLHWMLDILIDRQIADDFLRAWAAQTELAELHPKVPAIHRYEMSRVTARLFVGVGKGQILVSKEARCLLLKTWLEPFYEDFGWMRRACKGLDRHLIEDGLANTILTLPLATQQEIFLAWFDRFLNSGEDCPNIQRGFEVWWRRAFWRRNGEPEQPSRLRISVVENS
ncbi:BTB/POZ domain-containing protein [Rhynchospora pubera]|uniref:BTB/POZ domain-containing protein n=1 Tax=Rhynchospora pubera TaxID=906938 RepID=A0AAV8BTY1_9POAL|nr:BTB/POZ domain-containing protein [Rhynchospora pubera]